MKRLLFIFLLFFISSKSSAKSDFMVDGLGYKVLSITERTVEVTEDKDNYHQQQVIEVPDSVEYAGKYYKVVAIGDYAFSGFVELCRITLPKTVVQINDYAFKECLNLDSIIINGPIESIGSYAFYYCSKLKNISLPLSLSKLGACAFECSGLQTIVIPPNLSKLREYCFGGCMSLKEVYFSDSDKALDISGSCFIGMGQISPIEYAYYGRMVYLNNHLITQRQGYAPINTLIKATIGPNLKRADYLFRNCSNLEEVEIPNTFSHIGYYLFANCRKLEKIQIPDNLKKIDNFAFMGTSLKSFVLPNNLTEIGLKAFYNSNIETIVLPESLKSIGENCFNECQCLNKIAVKAPNPIEITENVFSAHSYLYGTLFVADGKKDLYMNAKYWSEFQNISEGNIKYNLIYNVDDKEYKNYALEAGEEIIPEIPPTKEGYTFSGWSETPEQMPAHDVTVIGSFTVNSYNLIFNIDGVEYKTIQVAYGTKPAEEAAPEKEGCTFLGWSEIPEQMPAHDVTITGSFTINSYQLTYIVDGEEYKTESIVYSAQITPEANLEREGYTFSGWSEIPEQMPAHDVTISGSFTVNRYTVTFMFGDEVLTIETVDYGATIPLPESLNSERYTLLEWLNVPETMPAHDITIYADFTDGMNAIYSKANNTEYYQLNGVKRSKMQHGLNIVKMKDGGTEKVLVK